MQTYANEILTKIIYTFVVSDMSLFFNHNILINIDLLELEDFNCQSDVGFLIDGSGSICEDPLGVFNDGCLNWIHVMNFLLILVNYMGIAVRDTHVSVALFGPYELRIGFNNFTDIDSFLANVSTIAYPLLGTDTTNALDMALTNMFQPINGMRDNVPQTLVFLTDGQCVGGCTDAEFLALRNRFFDRDIQVIGIGAGNRVNMDEIRLFVQPDRDFEARRFDQLYDRQFALNLELCQGSYK